MKISLKKLFFLIAVLCVGSMCLFRQASASILIDFNSKLSDEICIYYDNALKDTYIFDDAHMSEIKKTVTGRQVIRFTIPSNAISKLRIDFGKIPNTVTIYGMEVSVLPWKTFVLSGAEVFQRMEIQNDISDSQLKNDSVQLKIDGTDGFIACTTNLLSNKQAKLPSATRLKLILLLITVIIIVFADYVLKGMRSCIKYGKQGIKGLLNIIYKSSNGRQKLLALLLGFFLSIILAIFFDAIVLKIVYKFVKLLGLDTMSRFFMAGQTFSFARCFFFFNLIFITFLCLWLGSKKTLQYRYALALLLLLLMTSGKYTGSSIGFYDGMLYGNTAKFKSSTLLGIPQGIRGDEWATEKPYYFAQVNGGENAPYFNKKMMIDGADMVVSAFAPVRDIITLFRPSLWGFLFLQPDYAFAFYWWWKIIMLFMAVFELTSMLTNNTKYGLISSLIFLFSPPLQWWLSQTAPIMIAFGGFAVVLFKKYLDTERKMTRRILLVLMFYCLTGYTMTLYPANQIPFAYIFLMIVLYLSYKYRVRKPFALYRICEYIVAATPFVFVMIRFLTKSGPAIATQMETIYPGQTRAWISLPWDYSLYQAVNPFTAIIRHPDFFNSCEISQFYSFGIVLIPLICILIYKYRSRVLLPALLCGVSTFLSLIAWLPEIALFNKITLLSMSYPVRILMASGMGYTLTIITLLPIMEQLGYKSRRAGLACGIGGFALLCFATNSVNVFNYFKAFKAGTLCLIFIVSLLAYMAYLLLSGQKKNCTRFAILLVLLNFVSTVFINPLTRGTDSMFEKTTMKAIKELDEQESGRWMVSGNSTISNLVTAQGVARVSGTYYYPDWTMMNIIDPKHDYIHWWNQYAHIDMRLTSGENEISIIDREKSEKVDGTSRIIYVSLNTAKQLGVKYVFTNVGVPQEYVANEDLSLVYEDATDPWVIYKLRT